MKNRKVIQRRFVEDSLAVRLGNLAANLARMRSCSDSPRLGLAVLSILDESRHFMEWTAPLADLEVQVALLDMQREMGRWQDDWDNLWNDPDRRKAMADQSGAWSEKVLEWSGLLKR